MSFAVALCALFAGDITPADVSLNRPVPALHTGAAFRAGLEKPLTASWKNSSVRHIVRQVAANRKISVLLDRRIDPTQRLSFEFSQTPLRAALQKIAVDAGGQMSILGNCVHIGPLKPAARLRTLAALRLAELKKTPLGKGRLAKLGGRRTLHWNDLGRPADILRQIAARYDLKLEGVDAVPHDLWAGATLPNTNACEALTLVLNQFDLTFEWNADATVAQIVPVPADVSIERVYLPRGMSAQAAAADWSAKIAGLRTRPQNRRVLVVGTVEQHEAVAALLNPRRARPKAGRPSAPPVPLAKRKYAELRLEQVPAIALIKRLEKTGIVFAYDEENLKAAGIDLKQPISIDLKNASADELFAAFCQPLGLKFKIDGLTVTLSPK